MTDDYTYYDELDTFYSDCDDDSIASPDLSYDIDDVDTPDDIDLFYAQCCEIEVNLEKANTYKELHHSFEYEFAEQHLYLAKQIDIDSYDEPENDIELDNNKIYIREAYGQINTRKG